jgi:hypothetical protein
MTMSNRDHAASARQIASCCIDLVPKAAVSRLPPRRHPGQHRNAPVDVVIDDHLTLGVVLPVQSADVLGKGSLPGNRHRQEQGVEGSVVEAFTEVAAGCENESLIGIRSRKAVLRGPPLALIPP